MINRPLYSTNGAPIFGTLDNPVYGEFPIPASLDYIYIHLHSRLIPYKSVAVTGGGGWSHHERWWMYFRFSNMSDSMTEEEREAVYLHDGFGWQQGDPDPDLYIRIDLAKVYAGGFGKITENGVDSYLFYVDFAYSYVSTQQKIWWHGTQPSPPPPFFIVGNSSRVGIEAVAFDRIFTTRTCNRYRTIWYRGKVIVHDGPDTLHGEEWPLNHMLVCTLKWTPSTGVLEFV
ncbi:MAG: hypothetical protein ACOX9C_04465 [Kiritimatiellia bacterium]|jgi:hypothetical protein